MQLIVQKKGYRILPVIALAVAMAVLVFIARDTQATHNEGMLELDGNVAFDAGLGADTTGAGPCPYPGVTSGKFPTNDPNDCISTTAAFDWANSSTTTDKGACARTPAFLPPPSPPGTPDPDAGYITEGSPRPSVLLGADVICQADFVQGAADDISYHTGSDKDFQEITSSPVPGAVDTWHCRTSANATSKADILNAGFVSTTVTEGTDPHKVVYIGAERDSEHGDVFNGYWILQSAIGLAPPTTPPVTPTPAGQFDCAPAPSPRNFTGQHSCGDVLVRFNYQSGGRINSILVNEWISPLFGTTNGCDQNGNGAFDAGEPECTAAEQGSSESHTISGGGFLCTNTALGGDCRAASALAGAANTDDLCGRVNGPLPSGCTTKKPCDGLTLGPGPFSTPWEPNAAPNVVTPPTFSEMGIDLTGLHLNLKCIAAIVAESRSSPAVDATLKDFVLAPTGEECGSELTTEIHDASHNDITNTSVPAGTTVHDQATLTLSGSLNILTSTLNMNRYNNLTCAGTPAATTPFTISGSPSVFVRESPDFTTVSPTSGGISYNATYSGDGANYPAADSGGTFPCEPLKVTTSSLVTNIIRNDLSTDVTNSTVPKGTIVHDTATVTGTGDGTTKPTGTVTFLLFATGDCTGASTPEAVTPLTPGTGTTATAVSSNTTANATLSYKATYSGDTVYPAVLAADVTCERLDVTSSAVVTNIIRNTDGADLTNTIVLAGTVVHDTATVTGSGDGTTKPTGTVTFQLFATGDCTGASTPEAVTPLTPGTGTTATAVSSNTTANATLSYKATYSGDNVYPPVLAADVTCERLDIINPSTLVSFSDQIVGLPSDATGTVSYAVFTDSGCTTPVTTGSPANGVITPSPDTVGAGGIAPKSLSYTPDAPGGTFFIKAVFTGSGKYAGVTFTSCIEKAVITD